MIRTDIISKIGRQHLTSNIENGEFSYPKAFKENGFKFNGIENGKTKNQFVDIRFTDDQITILVETKQDFTKNLEEAKKQLSAYVEYEKTLTGNKIIAILANTNDELVKVWRGTVSNEDYLENEYKLKSFEEYAEYYTSKTNNKEKVMRNTYQLNELLHSVGIREKLRSQFVGTCLLSLKYSKVDLINPTLNTDIIRSEMKRILSTLLQNDLHRASNSIITR